MIKGFDILAPVYDLITKTVFGGRLHQAQKEFLKELPDEGRILILGGGTGWILEELWKVKPKLSIVYLDDSEGMIQRARRKMQEGKYPDSQLVFIKEKYENTQFEEKFDAVLSFFFLDLFSEKGLGEVIKKVCQDLSKDGKWFLADFQDAGKGISKAYSIILLWVMHRFFNVVCGIDSQEIKNHSKMITAEGWSLSRKKVFYFGMIYSQIMQRSL